MNAAPKNTSRKLLLMAGLSVIGFLVWIATTHRGKTPEVGPLVVARHDLVLRDGRWYRGLATNAFTGLMVDHFRGGVLMARAMISNGLPNGWSETWYTNGQMEVREGFRNGVSDGLREKWYQNGRKKSEANIVDGKIIGTFRSWHENGQLAEQIQMKQGEPDGTAWAYYPSGFAKTEVAMRDGKVVNQKSWKDGEHKTIQ